MAELKRTSVPQRRLWAHYSRQDVDLVVGGAQALAARPVLLCDRDAPLDHLASAAAARADRMVVLLGLVAAARDADSDVKQFAEAMLPLAEEVHTLVELLEERLDHVPGA